MLQRQFVGSKFFTRLMQQLSHRGGEKISFFPCKYRLFATVSGKSGGLRRDWEKDKSEHSLSARWRQKFTPAEEQSSGKVPRNSHSAFLPLSPRKLNFSTCKSGQDGYRIVDYVFKSQQNLIWWRSHSHCVVNSISD